MDSLPPPPPPPPPPSPFPNVAPVPAPAPKNSGGKCLLWGCGGCLGLVVLGAVFSAFVFLSAMSIIKKTDVYSEAFKRAQDSTEVQQALGTPIENGWSFSGSVNYNNGAGAADFTVPVSGPKGEGTLKVKADKSAGGEWQYSKLEVELPDGRNVDLRGGP